MTWFAISFFSFCGAQSSCSLTLHAVNHHGSWTSPRVMTASDLFNCHGCDELKGVFVMKWKVPLSQHHAWQKPAVNVLSHWWKLSAKEAQSGTKASATPFSPEKMHALRALVAPNTLCVFLLPLHPKLKYFWLPSVHFFASPVPFQLGWALRPSHPWFCPAFWYAHLRLLEHANSTTRS